MSGKAQTAKVRELKRIRFVKKEGVTVGTDFQTWLNGEASKLSDNNSKEVYLLSFHDDGVVWGKLKFENGKSELVTSGDFDENDAPKLQQTPSPEFRVETLQECRAFGAKGELLVWRVGENQFKARLLEDVEEPKQEENCFDESQVLWGTQVEKLKDSNGNEIELGNNDFTVVRDGEEGLLHAFPKEKSEIKSHFSNDKTRRKRPLRLCVRHYLDYDEDGCTYISLSRLVKVDVE